MKRKLLMVMLCGIAMIAMTGCGIFNKQKEVSLNSAYVIDYENKNYLGDDDEAHMIVVVNINPKKDILLDDITMSMNVGDEQISGSKYDSETKSDIVYDSYDNIKAGNSGKLAYIFEMEKYLYKDNNSYSIDYEIGTQKGEYSYVIKDTLSFKKNNVKEVDYLEDIVKGVYKDNANDALMILSLKWKIKDVYDRADAYNGLDFFNQANYQCYDWHARKDGKQIYNYFANGVKNNISISNNGYLNYGELKPSRTYDLPALDYDVLEKYYPGIKESLTKLSDLTNKYAKGLMNVKKSGSGECFRDILITDIESKASDVDSIMSK